MGGTAALSEAVADDLRHQGYRAIGRVQGPNRYATAVAAAELSGDMDTILVADGDSFQNALVASAAAGALDANVVLTSGSTLPPSTADYLQRRSDARIIAIGEQAGLAVPGATKVGGPDPYLTSAAVAAQLFGEYTEVALASGENFPDGIAGGAHAGQRGAPMLLTRQDTVPEEVVAEIGRVGRETAFLYGGTAAITDRAAAQVGPLGFYFRCSIIDCSITMSRTSTRQMCDRVCDYSGESTAVIAGSASAACVATGAGAIISGVCGTVAGAVGNAYFRQLQEATDVASCFEHRFFFIVGIPSPLPDPTLIENGERCTRASQ